MGKSAAWTRKAGKNSKGGLNETGRKSYEAANPGSNLKAPQPKGGSRRNSFCKRMCGMKAKRTGAKTAGDRNSRINKSLRAWNCGSCSNWRQMEIMDNISHFEFLIVAGSLIGIWIKHQSDYATLKSRVKAIELKNDEVSDMLKKLAEDIAEIKLLLARKQIDN